MANDCFEKALEILKNTLGDNHPDIAVSYNNIGAFFHALGDYRRAIVFFEKALEILKNTVGDNHPDVAVSYSNIGETYYAFRDYRRAIYCFQKALDFIEPTYGNNTQLGKKITRQIATIREKLTTQ